MPNRQYLHANGRIFPALAEAATAVPALKDKLKDTQHSVATRFFEVTGRIRLEQTVVEEQSLVSETHITMSKHCGVNAPWSHHLK